MFDLTRRENVMAIQTELIRLGLLDPPADGGWGPVTNWAVRQWYNLQLIDIDTATAQQTMAALCSTPTPELHVGTDFASRIVYAMQRKDYFINVYPDCVNIVYVEGVDPDGTENERPWNGFYDARCLVSIDPAGNPKLVAAWEATTQPSEYWTMHPMNEGGAFHIALGQYKAWVHGYHHTHEAWVQAGSINGYRDRDAKCIRDIRFPVSGDAYGVNQHWGYDLPRNDLENSSAGCLVGRLTVGHRKFMALTMADPRFQVSPTYRVMATILTAADVAPGTVSV
jgi:hypothetical protein